MKLLIYTAVWQRPEITEICFMGLNRMKRSGLFPMTLFAVISEDSMIPLCEKYGVEWCMHENLPLGAKKNYGVKQALKYDFDYMIEIGSDDLLKNEVLEAYKWDAPVLGLMDFALVNTHNGGCKRITTKIPKFGAGRAIQRFVLESCDLWHSSLNRGMDNNSSMTLGKNGFMMRGVKTEKPLCVALKSETNIWRYKSMKGLKYSLDDALSGLSDEEVTAIEALYATTQV